MADNNLQIVLSAKDVTGAAFASLQSRVKSLTKSVFSFNGAIASIAGGYTIKQITGDFYSAGIAADRLNKSMAAATGSIMDGAKAQKFIREQSERLGMEYMTQAEQFKRLAAAARGTNLEGEKTKQIYLGIAEAATALQMGNEEVKGALVAVEQMMSKGKVAAQELRQQLGERLPGAFQIAARAMGKTTAELDKMLEQGQLMADDFLPKFAAALRERFGKDVPAAANSAQASMNRLHNTWVEFQQAIMGSGVLDEIQKQVNGVNVEFKTWWFNNSELIKQNIPIYIGEIKDAVKGLAEATSSMHSIYSALPADVVSAAGYGLVGRIVFGGWGPAKIIAAVSIINDQLERFNLNLGSVPVKNDRFQQNIENITGVLSGKLDYNTGTKIQGPSFSDRTQARIDQLKAEILSIEKSMRDIEASGYTKSGNPIWSGVFEGESKKLSALRIELENTQEVLRKYNSEYKDFWHIQGEHFGKVGEYKDFWISQAKDVAAYQQALQSADDSLAKVLQAGKIAAAVAEAKKIEDIWLIKEKEKKAVAERGASARYEIEEFYAMKSATLDKELSEQRFQDNIDFWQIQAADKYEVMSRAADADIELTKKTTDEIERFHRRMWENIQDKMADVFKQMADGSKNFKDGLDDIAKGAFSELLSAEVNIRLKPALEKLGENIADMLNDYLDTEMSGSDVGNYAGGAFAAYGMMSSMKNNNASRNDNMVNGGIGGAAIGAQMGGGYGAAVGAIAGIIIGSWSDDPPSWFELYMNQIDELTAKIDQNNRALEAQLDATNQWANLFASANEVKLQATTLSDTGINRPNGYAIGITQTEFQEIKDTFGSFENYLESYRSVIGTKTEKFTSTVPVSAEDFRTSGSDEYGKYAIVQTTNTAGGERADLLESWWRFFDEVQPKMFETFENQMRLILVDIDSELSSWASGIGMGVPDNPGKSWEGLTGAPVPTTEKGKALAEGSEVYENILAGLEQFRESWDFGGAEWGADLVDQRIEKVKEIREEWLQAIEEEYNAKKKAITDDIFQKFADIATPMSDLAAQIQSITKQTDDAVSGLQNLGDAESEIIDVRKRGLQAISDAQAKYWNNVQASVSAILNPSSHSGALKSIIDQFDEWKKSLAETGAALEQVAVLESQRAEALNDLFTSLETSFLGSGMGQIESALVSIGNEFQGIINYLISIQSASADIAKYQDLWTRATISAMQAPFTALQGSITSWVQGLTRGGWGVNDWVNEYNALDAQRAGLDPGTASYHDQSIDLLSQQFAALQNIVGLNEEALSIAQQELATAQQNLDGLNGSISSIDQTIFDLTTGNMAAVQSLEGFRMQYDRLLNAAQTDMTDQSLAAFTQFATGDFMDVMGAFGYDQQQINDILVADFQALRQSYVTERDLLQEIVANTQATVSGLEVNSGLVDALTRVVSTETTLGDLVAALQASISSEIGSIDTKVDDIDTGLQDNVTRQLQTQLSTASGAENINYLASQLGGYSSVSSMLGQMTNSSVALNTRELKVGEGTLYQQTNPWVSGETHYQYVDPGESFVDRNSTFAAPGLKNLTKEILNDSAFVRDQDLLSHMNALSIMTGSDLATIANSVKSRANQNIDSSLSYNINGQRHGIDFDFLRLQNSEQDQTMRNLFSIRMFEKGGFSDRPAIFAESGPEWAVPTPGSPYHDSFLRSVGIDRVVDSQKLDPEAIGKAMARELAPLLMQSARESGSGTIQINLDSRVLATAVNKFAGQHPRETRNISNVMRN